MRTGSKGDEKTAAVVYHNSCFAMGTRLNVVIIDDVTCADEIFDEIAGAVGRLERKLSRFDTDSDVYRINSLAARQSVAVDSEMTAILLACEDYCRRSAGYFDITLPSRSGALAGFSMPDCVHIDAGNQTVAFSDDSIKIDLGGFGKGFALREILSILNRRDVKNVLVSFGESSILALGCHPYGDCWKVGIEDVSRPGSSAYVFELRDQSLSVSGFQPALREGQGFHIFSPGSASPIERTSTVAVLSGDALDAEILSTAVYAAIGTDASFIKNFSGCRAVRVDYDNDELTEIYTYE
ncbi:MAG: FAD:protein FMN transferase [Phycisphaerae bacterium]|jgi:thiamine biosynthesis lipoprotein